MKNTLVIVLVVLLVVAVGAAVYFFITVQILSDKLKLAGDSSYNMNLEIQTLKKDNGLLKEKVAKGLAYAESLDMLFDPARAQGDLPTRYNFSSETEILSKLTDEIEATGDSKLQDYLNIIKQGGNAASATTTSFMYYIPSAIVDTLK